MRKGRTVLFKGFKEAGDRTIIDVLVHAKHNIKYLVNFVSTDFYNENALGYLGKVSKLMPQCLVIVYIQVCSMKMSTRLILYYLF